MSKSLSKLSQFFSTIWKKILAFIDRRPMWVFFLLLATLIGISILGNKLRTPAVPLSQVVPPAKMVQVYQLDGAPSINVQAKIEKSGTISLVAQTAGVVQRINKIEGNKVQR